MAVPAFLELLGQKPSYVTRNVFKSRCKNSSSIEQEHSQACPVYFHMCQTGRFVLQRHPVCPIYIYPAD